MSRTIDERVVSMQFDNKQFESNVQTSLSTLDKLKQSLRLDGAAKGFDNIGAAAKNVNMAPLANAVETVRTKFSALQVMAVTALANITNSAVNAGKQLVKAFTIDPIKSGFQEYETQINAVQTILANTESKGSTLQDVNRALAELNTYADKTIYNFTEMTRNIGTFTAAGVDLKTSVSAIKGIANLAAVSGSTSHQASTAMYQLSQALASGTVKLMDWNSVVNAGMGGQVFQDALKETARVHGIAIDKLIEDEGSFRETLQKGWLTSEILTETLIHFTMAAEEGTEEWETYKKSLMDTGYSEEQAAAILKMANTATDAATKVKTFSQLMDTLKESAQSGWTKSWEIMIGDFEEAKGFLTDVSDRLGAIISESADARNKVLSGGLSSGWKQLLDAGIADEEGYKDTFKSVAKEHGLSIDDMIAAEKKLDDSLSDTEAFQKALKTGFKDGSLSADILSESVHQMADKMSNMSAKELEAAGYTKDHVNEIKNLSAGLKDGSISMDEFVEKINRPSGRENIIQALWNSFDGLMSVIAPIKEAFRDIFPPVTGEQLYKLTERIRDFTANLKLSEEQAEKVKSIFKGLFSVLDIGFTFIKKVGSGIIQLLGNFTGLRDSVLNTAGSFGDWLSNLRDSIKETDVFGKAIDKIVRFIQNGIDKIREFGSAVKEKFAAPGFEGFIGVITKILETLKTVGSKIVEIASNIGSAIGNAFRSGDIKSVLDVVNGGIIASILLGIRKYINGITEAFDGSATFVDKIKEILSTIGDTLKAWQQNIQAGTLMKIAAAIGILAASLLVLSTIDQERLSSSLGAITVLFAELIGSLAIFNKMNLNLTGVAKAVTAMIGMSVAILILASAMRKLSTLSWEEIAKGVVGVLGLTTILVAAFKIMATEGNKVAKGALQMVIMAAALKILASVCKDLSELSWEGLAKGLAGIAVLLAEISLFLNTAKFGGKAVSTAIGIAIMAAALKILASVCKDFSTMKWEDIGKGLAGIGGLLLEIVGFTNLAGNAKHIISTGVALIAIAAAMKIFANTMNDMSHMSWEEIAKGLAAIGGALLIIVGAMNLMPKGMIVNAIGLIGVAAAITILGNALTSLSGMSWEEIAKGLVALGGSLGILAGGLYLMNGSLAGSAALIVAAVALGIFAPVLKSLGDMSWGQIVKGLVALAGSIAVFGVAALVLRPIIPAMLKLSAAILIFGAGCTLAGVGITAIAAGLITLGAAIVVTASSIVETINTIVKGIGTIITSFCNAIAESATAIAEAFVAIIEATCYAIKESIPVIAETFFELLVGALTLLKTYIPQLVDLLADVLVGLMDGLADRMPDLANSAVNLAQKFVTSFTNALVSAFGEVDLGGLLEKLETVSKIFLELSIAATIISMIPITGALKGIAGLGIVVVGMSAILAALGGLSQIQGFNWLLTEGTRALSQIGTAIGTFVGNIVGSFAAGATRGLPKMAENLSSFMDNIQPFINGAKNIDASVLKGAGILAATVLCITASDVISSIASFLTGGSSIKRFGEEIAEFGTYLKAFSDNVSGINPENIVAAATAAKALAEMASIIPNEGGIAALFAGENSLSRFGPQLADFGANLKAFSDNVSGINPDNITTAATAGKALADMANTIPNEGGIVAWFTGDNSLAKFGPQIAVFGLSLKSFSDNVSGINPDNITAAATAGKALADMANTIPNEGGMVAWFTGENSIAKFGSQLTLLGAGLKGFAEVTSDINAEHLTGVITAAKALADMTSVIPNEGGMVAWFTGENSIAKFGTQLILLGAGLKGFAEVTSDINADQLTGVIGAAKALADMTNTIPNEGGMVAWFTGENSIAKFGTQLICLGNGLKGFADTTSGINADQLTGVVSIAKAIVEVTNLIPNQGGVVSWFAGESNIASYSAQLSCLGNGLKGFAQATVGINAENISGIVSVAKTIVEVTNLIPNQGGISAWFAGESNIANYGSQLVFLGKSLKAFADATSGINTDNLTGVATAAKTIAEITNVIPNQGGVVSWFTGESSISKFSAQLPVLGRSLKAFVDATAGINTDSLSGVTGVAKSIAELTNNIPNSGGVAAWFTGEQSISKFGTELGRLGLGLKSFAQTTAGINANNLIGVIDVAKSIVNLTNTIPNQGGVVAWFTGENSIAKWGVQLVALGVGLKGFANATEGINAEQVGGVVGVAKSIADMTKIIPDTTNLNNFGTQLPKLGESIKKFASELSGIKSSDISNGVSAVKQAMQQLKTVAKEGANGFADAFRKAKPNVSKAVSDLIQGVKTAIEDKGKIIAKAFNDVLSDIPDDIRNMYTDFYSAGAYLVEGFAQGITAQTFAAEAAASAMASAALAAAKAALDINSPSEEMYEVGDYSGMGFVNALMDYAAKAYKAGYRMANKALFGVSNAISHINDIITSDIDTQPTIRPVLDLSDISSGVGTISNMLGFSPSIGMLTNVGSISAMMNRNQNGANDDVISAINNLGRKLSNASGDIYNIDGITYDDSSNIADAVKTLVRAARVERRT